MSHFNGLIEILSWTGISHFNSVYVLDKSIDNAYNAKPHRIRSSQNMDSNHFIPVMSQKPKFPSLLINLKFYHNRRIIYISIRFMQEQQKPALNIENNHKLEEKTKFMQLF
jgi:hypothetical protein